MNVVLVTSRYPPYTGGVETHVEAIATRLVERGHDVAVLTADRRPLAGLAGGADGGRSTSEVDDDLDGWLPARETRDGVRIRRHRSFAPGEAVHLAPGVVTAVRSAASRADVVHAHNYHSLPLSFAALGLVGTSTPLVTTPHYHAESADGLRNRLLDAYAVPGGWALRRAAATVAVSEWERDALARDFGIDPSVVPNGIDRERFAGAEPVVRDRPYLLCVGRLETYKGIGHAIGALAELPDYELVVAGSGPARAELAAAARAAGVDDRTTFLGYVEDGTLPGLYAGAAAHLQLSSVEAFGVTVAESLAAGTPCVVRDATALGDWIDREDCVGVREPTPAAVARAVRTAVDLDAPAAPLADWADVVDDLEALYRRLAN